MIEKIS